MRHRIACSRETPGAFFFSAVSKRVRIASASMDLDPAKPAPRPPSAPGTSTCFNPRPGSLILKRQSSSTSSSEYFLQPHRSEPGVFPSGDRNQAIADLSPCSPARQLIRTRVSNSFRPSLTAGGAIMKVDPMVSLLSPPSLSSDGTGSSVNVHASRARIRYVASWDLPSFTTA